MGTDYGAFLLEAARVLKAGGWLWVAEVRGGVLLYLPFLLLLLHARSVLLSCARLTG